MKNDDEIIGTPRPLDFGLFAVPTVHPAPLTGPVRVTVSGGSALALARLEPQLTGLRGRVYAGIAAYGPVTREALVANLGIKENTVNGRCAELIAAKLICVTGYNRETGRGLLALTAS